MQSMTESNVIHGFVSSGRNAAKKGTKRACHIIKAKITNSQIRINVFLGDSTVSRRIKFNKTRTAASQYV